MTRILLRAAALLLVAGSLGACSSVPDWVDPTTWIGGDDSANAPTPPPDQTANTDANTQTADNGNGQFPNLADVPGRPTPPSTADDQKQVSDSLAADRNRQNYSSDQLRAGTEAAAAPPSDTPPPQVAEVANTPAAGSSAPAPSSDQSGASSTAPSDTETAAAAPATAPTAAPTAQVASAQAPAIAAPSGGEPAVPAVPGAQSMSMTDSALGFQPSKAPPLDASVAQFVPQPIIARYQQTAAVGGSAGVSTMGGPAVPAVPAAGGSMPAMGGPEAMSGAVVANYDALQPGSAVTASVYANPQGMPAAASIRFRGDTTVLSADARAQVKAAADSFNARGGTGYIRVVGHSSTETGKLSLARHLEINFEHSQARATAVMRELIKDGVPADKVLIEAVGDSQPVYARPAAGGDEDNRRADIFFEG